MELQIGDYSETSNAFHIEQADVCADVLPHTHNFIELAYLARGRLLHHGGGRTIPMMNGDYVLIDHSRPHSYTYCGEQAEVINCLFQPAFLDPTLRNCTGFDDIVKSLLLRISGPFAYRPYDGMIFHDPEGEIGGLLRKMHREYHTGGLASSTLLCAYLMECFILTLRQLPAGDLRENSDISYVRKAVEQRYMEPLKLDTLAAALHLSPAYLSRKFHETCGCGFSEYLQRERVRQACRLLAETNKKVLDIAGLCGYQDGKFFNTIFIRYMGMTPSAYRRQHTAPQTTKER